MSYFARTTCISLLLSVGCVTRVLPGGDTPTPDASPVADWPPDLGLIEIDHDLAVASSCPATIVYQDGSTHGLTFGPHNKALATLQTSSAPATNYEQGVVFAAKALEANAQFTPSGASPGNLGPADGSKLDPWLGELGLIAATCKGADAAGRTVSVDYFVPLTGAVGSIPANGAFLGSYAADGTPTYYADAVATGVVSTLGDLTLTHTLSAQEAADVSARGLFLRVYALSDADPTPVNLYVESIRWR